MTTSHSPSSPPVRGTRRVLDATLLHADEWGKVWFGLIFWGSVLFATAQRIWPDGAAAPQLLGALTIGGLAGIGARRRGYWL